MSSSGRPTGTVPKVKSRPNVSSRDLEQRRAPISNIPNNLQASSLEWQQSSAQPASSSSHGRARKPRNTRQPTRDFFDASLDSHDSHERLRPSAADFSHSLQTDLIMDGERTVGYEADSRRGGGEASLSQSLGNNPRRQDQPNNTLLDTKNNISKIPDRNQVLSRLNQIRDYVKQTSALMDSLRGSSDPRHIIQVIKLDHMNVDLRESENRLLELLNTLNALEGHEPLDNCSTPEHLERFSQLLEIVKTQEDTCLGLFKDGVLPDSLLSPQSPPRGVPPRSRDHSTSESLSQSRSRSTSEEPRPMPTAAQYAKHHELKLKVEESQKKLQALQEHQAALVALQHKAQAQLREAQAQQGALLATAADESPSAVNGNVENLNGRMQTLQDMFLNRNEVVHLLGEHDEELEAEHSALQERLQELQGRKQAMDRLVRDLHALGDTAPGRPVEAQPQQNGVDSSQAESSEEERDGEAIAEVSDKMEELSRMKARLAHLQSMVAAVNRGEMPHETVKAALTTRELASMADHQLPTIRAQRGERGSSVTKPDNIVLSSEAAPNYLEAQVMEIQLKTQQLDKAKQRLQQLRDLLGEVGIQDEDDEEDTEEREEVAISQQLSLESVQALSRDIRMQTLSLQAEREQLATAQRGSGKPGQQPASTQQQQQAANQPKNKNRDSSHRRPADTVGPSSRQLALQAELQAKRQELEELMRKDQGQSSSLNQDTCSEAGFSLPETSATWGGSSSSQTALLATVDQEAEAQEQSMACSSDDALDEPLMDGVHGASQIPSLSRHRQQSHLPLPPNVGVPHQQGWHQFRPKYDTVRKDSSDSRATTPRGAGPWLRPGVSPALGPEILGPSYDLPGSVSSSGATPRPPSETGSTNTQPLSWWPMQVQQQLEATTAMCQAMMQQWQWGQPGPEPWWNMQGPPAPVQQQQQLVATLSQCCHMLWVQHREMAALHATVQALQERVTCAERCGLAGAATPENNQANPSSSHHQPLKVSLSTGVFPTSPSDQAAAAAAAAAAAGVSSAHSLPNLCDGPPSLPHSSSSYMLPPPPVPSQFAWMTPPHGSRSSAVPTPSSSGMPSLLRHGPPATLNNQVPPGIRANNYWDNFRSYSRQNLLSASTKSNEGHMHNPSPIADRSHNSLRGAEPQQAAPPATINVTQPGFRSRKQKLNTEQRTVPVAGTSNPGASPSRHNPGPSSHSRQAFSPSTSQTRPSVSTQEQLYAELAALVAQNQSRPDFLPQLFRELQSLSCDSLCQRALQSIREISHTARGDSRNSDHASQMRPRSRESLGSYAGDKDEASSHVLGEASLPPPLLEEAAGSEDSVESQEGATALPLPGLTTPRPPPRTAHSLEPCISDLQVGALSVGGGHGGQLDVEIQGLLLQLLPFLKAHREDCCSPALLEAVRQRTLALVPPPSAGLNGFIQGQLDALLEDSLLKFQGCWLRDVGEELLTTIAEVLLNELTFFKLLDTVSRPGQPGHQAPDSTSATHLDEPCQPSGLPVSAPVDEMIEEGGDELGAIGPAPSQRNCWLPARLREGVAAGGWEARQEVTSLEAEAMLGCDGDLAEADQSHEDGRAADSSMTVGAPTSTSDSLGDGPISGRNSQAEGIAADDSSSDMAEDEMDNLEDLGAASLADNQVPTEDNGWHVEQDRELDQVPTRLEPGGSVPPLQQPAPSSPPPSLGRGPSPSSPRP